ncbi:ATP-binding protein [Streptacidiphilus jiangxiensis]|uniref:Adenylate and Guanylate cyclase catalytic domain-containing protein n=1 Tax=Streptacidiphilus jiangxiensis TaxID=235985 RepID=A0A1H7MW13_STRJI|nr:adenylate/guanylate cyclase domain-containing protein [Streptacidiphilus jiangxiensis]SEL14978.1 Adenylate and Guanylate cyclase catalytic domain-containing protein [Streptacidiphilus jiangxiensis]
MSRQVRCSSCHAAAPEAARFCPGCGSPLALRTPATDSRRIVTVLFMDLVSSTTMAETMDAEALHATMDRYYTACTDAIGSRGGVVEKFIGDAVMAVFGGLVSHEDDALRAVQAAAAILEALDEGNTRLEDEYGIRLGVHCGIATGEAVVVGSVGGGVRVVGDVVPTAARLQSQAQAHEVLIGAETARLVAGRVRLERLEDLTLRGKRDPVPAWRLLGQRRGDERDDLPTAVPLVGRDRELRLLEREWEQARREARCRLAVVTGPAGIGKTRLLREFTDRSAAQGHLVLRGACQPYGAGLTYRPVAEVVHSLADGSGEDGCGEDGWDEAVRVLRADHPNPERAVAALAVAVGRAPGTGAGGGRSGVSVPEIAWAFRGLVEVLARRRPVVLAFEDVQWAEPTLLDLLAGVAAHARDAQALIVCAARDEEPPSATDAAATEASATEGAGSRLGDATTVRLGPLEAPETRRLVALLAERAEVTAQQATDVHLRRIVEECAGHPLLAELLTDSLAEGLPVGGAVPTSIRVLLSAWLDRLPRTDRQVLERAACVGGSFTEADVLTLADDTTGLSAGVVADSLARLGRAGAVHPSGYAAGHRFTRMLARDTLYEMTPKATRAAWHTRLADRSALHLSVPVPVPGPAPDETHVADRAHHLESAVRLTAEVQPGHPDLPGLTARAAHALVGGGYQALHLRDLGAAISLMERGRALTPPQDREHRTLAVRISDARGALGEWPLALAAVTEAERLAGEDGWTRDTCEVLRATIALRTGDRTAPSQPHPDALDHLGWCRLHQYQALAGFADGRLGQAETAVRRALERAELLGDRYEGDRLLVTLCELAQWSPTPVDSALALCDDLAGRFDGDRPLLIPVLLTRARMLALAGDADLAREQIGQARRHATDLSLLPGLVACDQVAALVDALTGDHGVAATGYLRAAGLLTSLGQPSTAATLTVHAARAHLRAGSPQSSRACLDSLDGPDSLELRGRSVLLVVRARLALLDGESAAARAAVEEALSVVARTDDPCLLGEVRFGAAQVLAAVAADDLGAHRADDRADDRVDCADRADRLACEALDALLAKGAALPATEVRRWLDARRNRR